MRTPFRFGPRGGFGRGVRFGSNASGGDPLVRRLAHRLYGPGYNAETVVLTGDGTAKTYSATLVNESGYAISVASLVLQGWGLVSAGTSPAGNTFPVTGNIEYPVGGATQAFNGGAVMTVPNDNEFESDDLTLSTVIPAGASFKVNLSATVPNLDKYIIRLGFAGIRTLEKKSRLKKEAVMGVGDSIATNNGGAIYNAAAGVCPCYHFSIIGTTAQTYGASSAANFVRQVRLAGKLGLTRIISNFGTNDFGAARTIAQLEGDLQAMRTAANAIGIKFTQTTMLPRVLKAAAVTASGSVTSSGQTMTVPVPDATKFELLKQYTIAGATQTEYNGSFTCIGVDTGANTVQLLFVGSATTPATGTITIVARLITNTIAFQSAYSAKYAAGSGSDRGVFNSHVRGGLFDGFIEWADAVEPSRDSGRFKLGGEDPLLLATTLQNVVSGLTPTTTRWMTDYTGGSSTMANGVSQFVDGVNAGLLKGASNNTNGDYTVNSAYASAPSIGDKLYMTPGNHYCSDDGTHLRVAAGGKGAQLLIDNASKTFLQAAA